MSLSKKERDALPDDDFAVPGKRELPMHDEKHARLAWDMVECTEGLTDKERKTARERIRHKAKELGIDTKGWKAESEPEPAVTNLNVTLQAMSLNVPETPDHPNKMPFKGILTRIDEPSDNPPEGSGGKRVLLTRAAAEQALPTLLGMPVDAKANMKGHDVKAKVGTITAATIEGNAIHIEGFLYAADFPQEVRRIQSERADLGFSWEIQNIFVKDTTADPLEITSCVFTGAAILYKDKAAYTTTSLAAQAEENDMTKEILEAITKMGEQMGSVTTTLGTLTGRLDKIEASQEEAATAMKAGKEHMAKVEPHAAALESCAAAMEKDGIGGHSRMGHVKACRAMADHLRAAAATGKLADSWPGFDGFYAAAEVKPEVKAADDAKDKEIKELKDQVSSLGTKVKDMEAASRRKAEPAERKTLTPQITSLLARNGITLPSGDNTKLAVADIDKALASSGLEPVKRMEIKNTLSKAGLLAA
jgi:hypothetical protein